ncbi:MAG: PAQR family membrane homeostasis protein TrhA, partial [Pseudomonadota bacterium]
MYPGERFNSLSHLVGAVFALAGLVILVVAAAGQGEPRRIVAFSVYGATLFLLYLISTLYHSLSGRAKLLFRVLDHQAIYLLIAGTYTPFALITLRESVGWWLFGTIWTLALLGVVLDGVKRDGRRILPVVIYLVMGWMVVVTLEPLLQALPEAGFYWLLAGGLSYTLGVSFYILDHWYPWAHGVWH